MKGIIITGFNDLDQLQEYVTHGVVTLSPPHSTMQQVVVGYVDLNDPQNNHNVEVIKNENPVPVPTESDWKIRVNVTQDVIVGWRWIVVNLLLRAIAAISWANSLEFFLEFPRGG